MPQPILTDVATAELRWTPIPPDWILDGQPQARGKVLATSDDGSTWVMAWDCSAGRFRWHYYEDEIVYVTEGMVIISDDSEGDFLKPLELSSGDSIFFPKGTICTWHVPDHVRKMAILHRVMPLPLRLAWGVGRRINKLIRPPGQSPLSAGIM
jgi:uncharacterized cupin superfamily protein